MIKRLVLEGAIKEGRAQKANLVTHEIEYNVIDNEQEVFDLLPELYSNISHTIDGFPSLNLMASLVLNAKEIINKVGCIVDKYQAKHLLQEGQAHHFSINGEKVFSERSMEESKDLVLQLAEKILLQEFKEIKMKFKEYLDQNQMSYIDDEEETNLPIQGVW